MPLLLRILLSVGALFLMGLQSERALAQAQSTSEIIVRWNSDVSFAAKSPAATSALLEAERRFGVTASPDRKLASGGEVIRLSRLLTAEELRDFLATVQQSRSVLYAHENALAHIDFVPNDTNYAQQWQLFGVAGGIRAPEAWDVSTGTGVVVAVVDTGTTTHADLVRNVVGGYDFISDPHRANDGTGRDSIYDDSGTWSDPVDHCARESSWHGTHVGGIVAALTNNARGIAGVAFNARLLTVRVIGRCGLGALGDIADGMMWAAGIHVDGVPDNPHPARVINMSIGVDGSCLPEIQVAVDRVRAMNVLIVASAGNGNATVAQWPANCAGVVAVAATDVDGNKATFSNFGPKVDLAAPGAGVVSTYDVGLTIPAGDTYAALWGTSMAAPHVSGVAALVMSRFPTLTADQVAERLRDTARWFPGTCALCGWGIVNANVALNASRVLAPPNVTGLSAPARPDAAGRYTVTWSPADRATEYWTQRLKRNVWGETQRTTGTSWTLGVEPLPATYLHRVKACNDDNGCSEWVTGAVVQGCLGGCP